MAPDPGPSRLHAPNEELQEALDQRPVQLQRSGLLPAEAKVCLTIVEAATDETPRRYVQRFLTIVTEGWVHTYDGQAQHWQSWPRETVHWIEWASLGRRPN